MIMDSQSDLEVIVDFLEEYYQNEYLQWSAPVSLNEQSVPSHSHQLQQINYESPELQPLPSSQDMCPAELMDSLPGSLPNFGSTTQSSQHKCQARAAGSGKRVRLFHFLFELLEDPTMAHCVSWVPPTIGVFCFSSTNKDQVATLWGQRKGNKRPMTYQKMSRALRNYARSGEILKVKKKLTYQFSLDTLLLLQTSGHRPF
ncbi:transcription factor Spi-C [Eucyclogobius newberryi]|uniref:transcription factor Spi-C n=1 Tax=Eucyclogobius newberryi TaxID=166745 RepID=UPI003B5B5286